MSVTVRVYDMIWDDLYQEITYLDMPQGWIILKIRTIQR